MLPPEQRQHLGESLRQPSAVQCAVGYKQLWNDERGKSLELTVQADQFCRGRGRACAPHNQPVTGLCVTQVQPNFDLWHRCLAGPAERVELPLVAQESFAST